MTERDHVGGQQMAAEIVESVPAVRRILTEDIGARPVVESLRACRGVALAARGSSDHAAAYARYLLEQALGVPVWSVAPSQTTRYGNTLAVDGLALIAVSQSGRTPEIVSVAESWKSQGAYVAAITNDPTSELAALVPHPLLLDAGEELAVPATKTFSATLAMFLRIGAMVDASRVTLDAPRLLDAFEAAVQDDGAVSEIAAEVDRATTVVHLGRGFLLPIAREGALKCIETARAPMFAWSPVDFRHGPFALAGADMCAVVHHADGKVAGDTAAIARDLSVVGATVTSIGTPIGVNGHHVGVPADLEEHERPLVHAVRAQQLALTLARIRGLDPDHPMGLNKVTATT